VLRSVMTVDLRKDGAACFSEDRIAWTRVHVRSGKRAIGFQMDAVHATRHVLQRRVERSDCPLDDLLGDWSSPDFVDGYGLRDSSPSAAVLS
jgi:hypothetical protein